MKYAVITGFLGNMKDRFHGHYGQDRSISEKFALASQIQGIKGLELIYPYDYPDVNEIKDLQQQYGLEIAAINLNVKAEPEFRDGSYTNPSSKVRKLAMQYTEGAIEAAAALNCNLVTCCPLADGHDVSFQTDYRVDFKRLKEAVNQAALYDPSVRFSLEYKPTEPRVSCYLDTAATTLLLVEAVGHKNVGVTIDVGHSLCAAETPGRAVALLGESDRLFYVHVNDNNRAWDWDLVPGTEHIWALVEFLVYLNQYNHANWFTADMMPARIDPVKGFSQTYRVMKQLQSIADQVDLGDLQTMIAQGDVTDVYDHLWGLLGNTFGGKVK